MLNQPADYLLVSDAIFTAKENYPISGYIAIKGDSIIGMGNEDKEKWIGPDTIVYDLENRLVTPGYHDNHTFFTGTLVVNKGLDLSKTTSEGEAINEVVRFAHRLNNPSVILGYGWNHHRWKSELPISKSLDVYFPETPVVLFHEERDRCWMNEAARQAYDFNEEQCYFEAMVKLLKEIVKDKEHVEKEFLAFSKELSSRGITSIKDIAYDDYLGILPMLEDLEAREALQIRMNFASQPVQNKANIDSAKAAQQKYKGNFLKFQGIKFMVDGIIPEFTGDLLEPYSNKPNTNNVKPVDYDTLRKTVFDAHQNGVKCCLNADGDAAVRRSIDILEECIKTNGSSQLIHSLSDVSLCHDQDIKRLKSLNLAVEVYLQFLLLFKNDKDSYINEFVGEERERFFNNFGTMAKEGVLITAGTDLPLFYPHIPDSIYSAVGRLFADGQPERGWQKERGLSIAEVLKAWTINGARHCAIDDKIGTLEVGKLADIAVLDRNIFDVPMNEMREVNVCLTMSNGKIVFKREHLN